MLLKEQEAYLINNINYWGYENYKLNLILKRGSIPPDSTIEQEALYALIIQYVYKEVLQDMKDLKGNDTNYEYIQLFRDPKSEKLRFYTWLPMIVIGEEFKGWQTKAINVVFAKDLDISEITDVGTILIDTNVVKIPKVYEIKSQDGYKKYPYIYINQYIKYKKNGNIQQGIERFKNETIIIK